MRELLMLAVTGFVALVAACAWLSGQVCLGIACTALALSLTDHALARE